MGDSMGSVQEEADLPGVNASPWSRCERAAWSAVLVGLILRLWEYLRFRALYMDERALLSNLVGVPVFDFHHILKQDQLAPPGFLVVERVMVRLPVSVLASGRLFPLACGMASMLLIVPLARRYVTRLAVPIAAGVLALSDHLIYYSAEIKPYACDLAAAMAALLIAAPDDPARPSPRRLAGLAAKVEGAEERQLKLPENNPTVHVDTVAVKLTGLEAAHTMKGSGKIGLTSEDLFVRVQLVAENVGKAPAKLDLDGARVQDAEGKPYGIARDVQALVGTRQLSRTWEAGERTDLVLVFEVPPSAVRGTGLTLVLPATSGDVQLTLR